MWPLRPLLWMVTRFPACFMVISRWMQYYEGESLEARLRQCRTSSSMWIWSVSHHSFTHHQNNQNSPKRTYDTLWAVEVKDPSLGLSRYASGSLAISLNKCTFTVTKFEEDNKSSDATNTTTDEEEKKVEEVTKIESGEDGKSKDTKVLWNKTHRSSASSTGSTSPVRLRPYVSADSTSSTSTTPREELQNIPPEIVATTKPDFAYISSRPTSTTVISLILCEVVSPVEERELEIIWKVFHKVCPIPPCVEKVD